MRVALEAHLLEKSDMSVLKLGVSFREICCEDVAYAKSVTADLVCISRTDAFECGSDLSLAHGCFVGSIKKSVGRKDQVGLLGDHDALSYRNAGL